MKILIVYQHYWPENFRITDIAESLVALGHDVTVLCGLPNYPKGYIYDDYKHGKNRNEIHNGVKIIRAKEIGRRNNILFRFLNYWSYPFFASKLVNKLDDDFDIVHIEVISPIMMAKPGLKYAKKYHKKVVMYEMDLWPESLLAGNIKKDSLIYNHYKKVSSRIYSKCDTILVSTKEHIDYIKSLPGCQNIDMDYLPQYAESIFENSDSTKKPNGKIDLMFAGYIGKAQDVFTIVKAAALLKNDPKYQFHIIGDGSELTRVKELAQNLNADNIIFYGQKPLSEMPQLYCKADVMLLSLENKSYANMTIPGKMQSYMASGKPVIGVVNGSSANFIIENKMGYVCPSGDYESLANLIKSLDITQLSKIGKIAKEEYIKKYSKEIFINKLLSSFE